jgi:hypothetical protein
MKLGLIGSVLIVGSLLLIAPGCGSSPTPGNGDGVDPKNAQALSDINTQAKTADGDFDKLTAAGKAQALQMANGDEQSARKLIKMMAHPPNETHRGRPGSPPPAPGQQ